VAALASLASPWPGDACASGSADRADSSGGQSRGYSPRLRPSPPGTRSWIEILLASARIRLRAGWVNARVRSVAAVPERISNIPATSHTYGT